VKSKKILDIVVVLGLTFSGSWAVAAQVAASATISGFNYQLIDLAPGDGIAPSLTFNSPSYWIDAAGYPDNTGYPNPIDIISSPGSASIATQTGHASSSYDGATATSSVSGNGTIPSLDTNAIIQSNFVLSAHTEVIFTAYGSVSGATTGGISAYGNGQIFAAYYDTPSAPYETYLNDELILSNGSQNHIFSVSVSSGDETLDGRTGIFTNAGAQNITLSTPVPEPASESLFIGGLLAIIYQLFRRKKFEAAGEPSQAT
jgi:hypothetical protein